MYEYEEEIELFGLDAELGEDEGYECANCGQDTREHNDAACQD